MRARRVALVLAIAAGLAWVASQPLRRFLGWGRLLQRFGEVEPAPSTPQIVARLRGRRWPAGPVRAEGPAVVLVHGVHPEGGEEPRMARLATLFAERGFVVHVPHLPELADFEADPAVVERLTRYFDAIERRHGCFGVVGISVGGGLALRALEDRPTAGVLTVGAHADLEAVRLHHQRTGEAAYARQVRDAVGEVGPEVLAALSPRRPPRGPVWVLHGEGDPLIPPSEAAALCLEMGCDRAVRTRWLGHTEVHGQSPMPVVKLLDQAFGGMSVPCERLRQYTGRR